MIDPILVDNKKFEFVYQEGCGKCFELNTIEGMGTSGNMTHLFLHEKSAAYLTRQKQPRKSFSQAFSVPMRFPALRI